MSFHARSVSAIRVLATVAALGAFSAPALAQDEYPPIAETDCAVPGIDDCGDGHLWARYSDGLTPEQRRIIDDLMARLLRSLEARGDSLTADQVHAGYRGFVRELRTQVGDEVASEFLSFDVMEPVRSAAMTDDADAWLDHVVTLPISDAILDFGADAPEPEYNVGTTTMKLGFAIVGASAGFGVGNFAGLVAGAAAGAAFGEALAEGLGMDDVGEGGPDDGSGSGAR